MPLFLERFILPAFAAIVVIVAITNPMHLDKTQRITGAAAIILAAYFVAHTLYKEKEVEESPLVGDVQLSFMNSGQFWAVYQAGRVVSPVDAVLALRVVNNGSLPVSLDSVSVELKRGREWMPLRHIPNGISPFFGTFTNARLVEISPVDLDTAIMKNSDVGPGKAVNGVQLFEYGDPSFLYRGETKATFRVTVRDALKRRSVTESTPEPADPSDPYLQSARTFLELKTLDTTLDLSKLQLRRFSGK